MLHHIQKSIIDVLAHTEAARYADLKPANLDGNQFTYHLRQLLADRLVIKNNDGTYSLTQKGRTYLVTRYENPDEMAHTIFLVIIRHDDKLLMRERKVQPLLGYAGFIHGEPVVGKTFADSVRERVVDKTGIDIGDMSVHGSGLIRQIKDGQPQSFSHAIIVSTSIESEDLPVKEDQTGRNFWVSEKDLESVPRLLPSCMDILRFTDNPNAGWFEETYEI